MFSRNTNMKPLQTVHYKDNTVYMKSTTERYFTKDISIFHGSVLEVNHSNTVNCYWILTGLCRVLSLRSRRILSLLIHRDLCTSVVFVTGISSSLRPVLLWREQAFLMLLTELIRPSIYQSLSPSLSLVLSALSLAPSVTHALQERSHSGSHVLMTEHDWPSE